MPAMASSTKVSRAGGTLGSALSRRSIGSALSAGSVGCVLSAGSVGSALSAGSIGSALSIGSIGSALSIGSIGSALSIGSAGSLLSVGSVNSVLAIGGIDERRRTNPPGHDPDHESNPDRDRLKAARLGQALAWTALISAAAASVPGRHRA